MPLYDYECSGCEYKHEVMLKVADLADRMECPLCSSTMDRILVGGHGGFQSECPSWIDDTVRGALQGDGEAPISTRTDYNRALKEKNIEPIERGHRGRRMI